MILLTSSRQVHLASMAVLLSAAALLGSARPARAQAPDVPTIDDANPAAALGSDQERAANPLRTGAILMELIERADSALTAGDGARAARYFEAMVSAVPEQALGHRKLCEARSLAGDFDGAIKACRAALQREGSTVQDHVRHLAVVLAGPAQPSPDDTRAVDSSLAHVEEKGATNPDLLDLSCQLALRLDDAERLATCVKRLEAAAREDSRTPAYAWALAMGAHDEARARAAFGRAQELHHDPEKLEEMEAAMTREFPQRTLWYWAAGVTTLAGLGLLLALRLRATPAEPTSRTLERTSSPVP